MDEQTKDPDVLNVLVLERVDRTKNMARYYVLSVEPRDCRSGCGWLSGDGGPRNADRAPDSIAASCRIAASRYCRVSANRSIGSMRVLRCFVSNISTALDTVFVSIQIQFSRAIRV